MEDAITTRHWIEERYGPIERLKRSVVVRGDPKDFFVASVALFKGFAFGIGFSEAEAIESLKADLTVPPMGGRSNR